MKISDLADEIAGDVSGDKTQFAIIIVMIIEAVVSFLIQWFIKKYSTKEEAAEKFLDYYNNMGPIRRMKLNLRVYWEMKKHPPTDVPNVKLADAMVNKFKSLTVNDFMEMVDISS